MKKISSILIVDDSEMDHLTAKYSIEDFDDTIEVLSAYDGQEALDLLSKIDTQPDVIFLDINMPGMNGHEFLVEYNKGVSPITVVVMLTSSEQAEDKEKCEAYSFVKEYISKPLEPEHLQALSNTL